MIEVRQNYNFSEIFEIWDWLYRNNKDASIYQSSKYNELIWSNIHPYRLILRMTPVFYVFYENEKPILIVPLFKSILKNKYHIFGDKAGCGYLDFIYDDTCAGDKIKECLNLLREKYGIIEIYLNHVRYDTTLGQYAIHNGAKTCEMPCVSILLPEEYDAYNKSLSKNMRQNIRTAYNRLAKDGKSYDFRICSYSDLSSKEKRDVLDIYIERQISKYKKFGKIFFKYFALYIDIGTKAENCDGLESLYALMIDGRIAAFFDAIYDGKSVVVPRLCIVEEFGRYSPGVILINEAVKWMLEKSEIRRIDLTHGNEQYKKAMGGQEFFCVEGKISI